MTTISTPLLSASGDRWIRRSSVLLIVIVGTSAGLLSWNGLTFLAVQSGVPAEISWLLPCCVDGMILLATTEILQASLTRRSTKFGWGLSAFGVSLSIWGNTAAVSAEGLQSISVHAIAPISLFLSTELFARLMKHKIAATQEAMDHAQRIAEREAKRREKSEQRATASSQKTEKRPVPPKEQGSQQGRLSDADEEVTIYRQLMESMPVESSKAAKIEAVLKEFPSARNGHIAYALGVEIKSVATSIVRVKEKLTKEKQSQESSEAFTEIVKDFAPVGD